MLYQVTVPLLEKIQEKAKFTVITDLGKFASGIVGMFLVIASVAAFLFFAWGGVQWILSGSDKNKLDEAKTRITNAIVGLAIVAVSWAVFLIINGVLGLNTANGGGGGGGNNNGGNNNGGNNNGNNAVGNANCGCYNGGCAFTGQVGPMDLNGTSCYICREAGWQFDMGQTGCQPISCGVCPQ